MVALADKLAAYATLSSLRVCARTVLSARRHGELLRANPDLTYAVLMPWIDGPTWTEIILDKRALTREQSFHLAYALAENLAAMEERGVAHCDLSAPNVLVPLLAPDSGLFAPVELVDVEQLYAPDLARPEAIPSGSLGYAHQTAREGLWHAKADRFAGAILIAEMLGWCDARVQIAAWGESYFDPNELQQDTGRYQNLIRALRDEWGDAVAKLFARAWRSDTLDDCPTFGEWLITLPANQPRVAINVQVPAHPTISPRAQDPLIAQAIALEQQGDLSGALNVYQNMLARLAQKDPLRAELAHIIARLETASNNAQQIRDWIVQANVDAQGGNWKRAAMGYRYALDQSPASPYAEEWRAASARCEDEAELAEMFDAGVAALQRGDKQTALELLGHLVRQRPAYARQGRRADSLFREVEKQFATTRPKQVLWVGIALAGLLGLIIVIGAMAYIVSQANRPTQIASPVEIMQLGKGTVNKVLWSPRGQHLAVASSFGIYFYDPVTFQQTKFVETNSWVGNIAFSSDDKTLASWTTDGIITLWDVVSGRELRKLSGNMSAWTRIEFSTDRKMIAVSDLGLIKLWDISSGRELQTLSASANGIYSITFSPDNRMLASGLDNGNIQLWEVTSGREVRTLSGHSAGVSSIVFSPDGKVLASGSNDATIKFWDVASGRELRTSSGHTVSVASLAISSDGKMLVSGSGDNTIKLWDMASGRTLRTLNGHRGLVHSVAFSPDGKMLVSGAGDGLINLWDIASGRVVLTISGYVSVVTAVAFSPDGETLALAPGDYTIQLWDIASGYQVQTLSGHTAVVTSIALSPDGKMLASGSVNNSLKLWEIPSGRQIQTLNGGIALCVTFSPDSKILASLSGDAIRLWDVASGRELRTLSGHSSVAYSGVFSPDGKIFATGSRDETVKLWDVSSGRVLQTLIWRAHPVTSVAFSPDGKILASGAIGSSIKLWDVSSGRELRTLNGHTESVYSVAFSPNGKILASGAGDKTVILWDVASGRELATLKKHRSQIQTIAFSPDGKILASGSNDGTVQLWGLK
jgi:WD40 repeat protein/tetratricopeptide (TPR) repeat protein